MSALSDSRVLRTLASLKLAAALIALFALLSILAVVIPQRGYLGQAFEEFATDAPALASAITALGLERIYSGWPIIVLATLLGVNLVACTLRRALLRTPTALVETDVQSALNAPANALRASGWKLLRLDDHRLIARKGGSGFWGSVLMHAGIVVIVTGAAATSLTTFRGEMVISEGQTVIDERGSYLSVEYEPRIGSAYSGTRIALDATDVTYEQGILVSAVARMRAIEPSGKVISRNVRVNHPLDAGGKSYLLQSSGYVVRIVAAFEGAPADPLVVALADETPNGWADQLELVSPTGAPVMLEMLATPVPMGVSDTLPIEKYALDDPRLRLFIRSGESVWEGILAPGEATAAVEGLTITFEGLGLWNRYLVRGEPARWITYAGFWIAVAGAAWRFMVPERRVSVVRRSGVLTAQLRSHPWKGHLAAQDEVLVQDILERVDGGAGDANEGVDDDDR